MDHDPSRCRTCARLLVPAATSADPLAEDCGGDCYGCLLRCEHWELVSDLSDDDLRLLIPSLDFQHDLWMQRILAAMNR